MSKMSKSSHAKRTTSQHNRNQKRFTNNYHDVFHKFAPYNNRLSSLRNIMSLSLEEIEKLSEVMRLILSLKRRQTRLSTTIPDSDPEFANEPSDDETNTDANDISDPNNIEQDVPGKVKMDMAFYNKQIQYFEQYHPAGLDAFKASAIIVAKMPKNDHDPRAESANKLTKSTCKSLKQPTRKFNPVEDIEQLDPVIIDEDIERKIYQAARQRQMEQHAAPPVVTPQSQEVWDELKAETKCVAYNEAKKAYAQARKDGTHIGMTNPTQDPTLKPTRVERKLYKDLLARREAENKRHQQLKMAAKRDAKKKQAADDEQEDD